MSKRFRNLKLFGSSSREAALQGDNDNTTLPVRTTEPQQLSKNDSYGIKILHDPPSASVDIVFVHGLTGNAYNTWLHEESGIHWPRDFVKDDIESARIMTFGYDADVLNWWKHAAQDGISGYSKDLLGRLYRRRTGHAEDRRIIFVVHSLGGLVVQRALSDAEGSPQPYLKKIGLCTAGICFLGTPHQGSEHADWLLLLTNIAGVVKPVNSRITGLLRPGSELLADVRDRFHEVLENRNQSGDPIEIVCFYETLPVARSLIVPKNSATMPGKPQYPIHANHMNVTKFSKKQDDYAEIVAELQRMLVKVSESHPVNQEKVLNTDTSVPAAPLHYIPIARNDCFVGRQEHLDVLEEKLFKKGYCPKVALFGLGGVGKTQIALEFAFHVQRTRPSYSILWIPAVSQESFEQAYYTIALRLKLLDIKRHNTDVRERVKEYFSRDEAGQWLFILDNAGNPGLVFGTATSKGLNDWIPSSIHGSILYTTRNRKLAVDLAKGALLEVTQMRPDLATQMLEVLLHCKERLRDSRSVEHVLEFLTYLPLAIFQAAAYINANDISFSTYLNLLQDTEENMLAILGENFQDSSRYKETDNAVAATWIVSFGHIQESYPPAARLLEFMSCLEPKAIPDAILLTDQPKQSKIKAIGTLKAYAFISERDNGRTYDMHRLVHIATSNWLRVEGCAGTCVQNAIRELKDYLPRPEHENRALWTDALPHVQRILDETPGLNLEARYYLCQLTGYQLYQDGRTNDAIARHVEAYEWNLGKYGTDHQRTLHSAYYLAMAYRANGQFKEAIELLEHVVHIRKALPEESQKRLAAERELAHAYRSKHQIHEAIRILEHVVQIQKRVLPKDHRELLYSQCSLAHFYLTNKQVQQAVELFEHVVQVQQKTLAEGHPNRLASEHELARAYVQRHAVDDIQNAIRITENVVQITKKMLQDDHPDRLDSEDLLAHAYMKSRANGEVQKAIDLLEHITQVGQSLPEKDQIVMLLRLALAYLVSGERGQAGKAIEILEYVDEIGARCLPEDDPRRFFIRRLLFEARQASRQKNWAPWTFDLLGF